MKEKLIYITLSNDKFFRLLLVIVSIFCLQACEDFLLENMTLDNVIGMMKISRYLHCPGLEKKTRDFVLRRFKDVANHSNEFLQLTPEELAQVDFRY